MTAKHVLMAANPQAGHVRPLLQIAVALHSAGYPVDFLTGSRFERIVTDAGVRFHPLVGAADYDAADMNGAFDGRADITDPVELLNFDMTVGHAHALADQQRSLLPLVRPDTIAVYDGYFVGLWPQLLGAPGPSPVATIGVGAVPLMLASDDTTPTGPQSGGGVETVATNRSVNAAIRDSLQPAQDALAAALLALGATREPPPIFDAGVLLPDLFAQLSTKDFEFPRSDAPPGLRYVGPLRPGRTSIPLPDWWDELDGDRPLVVVTQGTLDNHDFGKLIEPTAQALSDVDVEVVAALGRSAEIDITWPRNFHAAAMLPFDRVLPRAALLVTNGGYGGTQQALLAGTPVLVAGVTHDKPAVAARVAHHGYGLNLATERPTPAELRAAALTILEDTSFGQRVGSFARRCAGADGAGAILELVRDVAGRPNHVPGVPNTASASLVASTPAGPMHSCSRVRSNS